ncbi:MAG: hypothetical protein KGJ23_12030 [Euryarchaeota archaeon]|nr:hypothetical protein [Euryarchaeota archaeon]MDE1837325.1 hypothetical protein [Euryarchaeota archaeon]MDE2045244.1 hypothetical protein [Thermoplasmata archaeon]
MSAAAMLLPPDLQATAPSSVASVHPATVAGALARTSLPALASKGAPPRPFDPLANLPSNFRTGPEISPGATPQVSPKIGINYQATWDPTPQNEPGIAVNPTNPLDIIVSGNDYDTAATGSSGSWASEFTSTNGGLTWHYRPAAMNTTFAGGHPCFGGDTNVFFAPDGTAYFAGLGYPTAQTGRCSGSVATNGGLFVAHSADGGLTWNYVRVEQDFGSYWVDKEWMGVDPSTGTVSIDVMNYSSTTAYIDYWYSTTKGASWVGPTHINSASDQNMVAAGLAVDSSGGVDVVWEGGATGSDLEFSRATAPGGAFSAEANLGSITCAPAGSSGFPAIGGVGRMNCFPQIFGDTSAGSPYKGDLYIVYTENVSSLQIRLLRSTNYGSSWSSPISVNNDPSDGADHWFPQLAVGKNGTVYVEFLDRRYVPGDFYVDTTVAVSKDGGQTFARNVRVSSVSGNPTVWSAFMGDYENTFWSPAGDFSVWTDFRNGVTGNMNEDLYVGQLAWLDLSANIAGVTATVDGVSTALPSTEYWTRGTVHNISVPASVTGYTFSHWQGMFASSMSALTNVAMNGSSPLEAIYNPSGTPTLSVSVTTTPSSSATSGSTVAVIASVTSAGVPVPGASVSFSDTLTDSFSPNPVTVGANGNAWTNFTAPTVLAATSDTITASATAGGYNPGSGTAVITIDPLPLQVTLTPTPSASVVGGSTVAAVAYVSLPSGSPVSGANVGFSDTSGSSFTPASTTTDAAGYAYANFTTPSVTTPTSDTVDAAATAPGHPGNNGTATLTLDPEPTLSVALSVTPNPGNPGSHVTVHASVTDTSGAVAGATVAFADQKGDLFSPASGTTNVGGSVWSNFTLPATSVPLTLDVWANASASLAHPGGVYAAVVDQPVLTGSVSVPSGATTAGLPAAITVAIVSSGTPIQGATATFTDSLGGTFSPPSTSSTAAGAAFTNLTVSSVASPSTDTISVALSKSGYAPTTLTATVQIDPAPPLLLNLSAASYEAVAGSTVAVHALLESAGSPVAGASESFSVTSGSLSLMGATTPTNGTVDLLLTAPSPSSATTVTLTAHASEPGYTTGSGTLRLYVVLPMAVVVTPTPNTISAGGTVAVVVSVTDGSGAPISGATLALTVDQGTITPASGATDTAGKLDAQLTAPSPSSTVTATITVSVTATGRESAQGSAQVTITPAPSNGGAGDLVGLLTSPLVLAVLAVAIVGIVVAVLLARKRRRASVPPPYGPMFTPTPPSWPPPPPPPPR